MNVCTLLTVVSDPLEVVKKLVMLYSVTRILFLFCYTTSPSHHHKLPYSKKYISAPKKH